MPEQKTQPETKSDTKTIYCIVYGCNALSKGWDIDRRIDSEGLTTFIVYYRCDKGHDFCLKIERGNGTDS